MRPATRPLLAAALLAVATPAFAATPLESLSASPDTTTELGAPGITTLDEDAAVDDLAGGVTLENLGPLPPQSDVSGYATLPSGDRLLCFDTSVELPGPVLSEPGDVVRYDGAVYTLEFDASANGVPSGSLCDAVTVDGSSNLVVSFDTTVSLPGAVVASDEDLVRVDGPSTYSLLFDGSAAGVPTAADVDGAHLLANGNVAVSLDVTATVGGVGVDDEDVLEYDPGAATWSLAFDGSAQDADWLAADADAIALPEPSRSALLVSGILGLLTLARRRDSVG